MNTKRVHFYIIGWNTLTKVISQQIARAGMPLTVIIGDEKNKQKALDNLPEKNVDLLINPGHAFDFYKKKLAGRAAIILINLEDEIANLSFLVKIQKNLDTTAFKFIVPINNTNLRETFEHAGVTYVLSKDEIIGKTIAGYLYEKDVALYINDLFSTTTNEKEYDMQQFLVTEKNPYLGRTYDETFRALKLTYNSILVGLNKSQNGSYILVKNPSDNPLIQGNDYLIVITNGINEKKLEKAFRVKQGVFT